MNVYANSISEDPKIAKAQHELLKNQITSGTELSVYDHRYNCHGFTFISRLGFIGIADYKAKLVIIPGRSIYEYSREIEFEDLRKALTEYERISEVLNVDVDNINYDKVKIGDIVLYKSGGEYSHSGIIFQIRKEEGNLKEIKVVSKFGHYGEFLHSLIDPYVVNTYGKHIEFWKHKA